MGKGKSSSALEEAQEHRSRPLATLKDPNAFGPPPKHINYHGGIAAPNTITPNTQGWGAPLHMNSIRAREEEERETQAAKEAEEQEMKPPPGPFQVDTTGLSTRNLPKPPIRRVEQDASNNLTSSIAGNKPKPSLPPRLPPRQNSGASTGTSSPPPSYNATVGDSSSQAGYLNQGALNRLGAAGVSVPEFGIGKDSESRNPWQDQKPPAREAQPPSSSLGRLSGMNELQGRFPKMSPLSSPSESPSQGTSFAQKQAALKTANSFRNDPSSISLSDARNAASTANNFRERHGDQVAAGWQSANNLNKKYGVMERINSSSAGVASPSQPSFGQTAISSIPPESMSTEGKKKAPPPPPPKKKLVDQATSPAPPPIPLSSKPRS